MKKVFLALILVLAMAFPAMAETQLGKDFVLDGHVAFGYVVSSDYSAEIDGIEHWFTDQDEDGSSFALVSELGVTWKNTIRPYVLWNAISGTGSTGDWAFKNYTFSTGIEYFLWKTDYGKLGLYGCYNESSVTLGDAYINYIDVDMTAKERTWIVGVDWRF